MPITWRNINAPEVSGAAALLDNAGESISGAFDKFKGLVKDKQALDSQNQQAVVANNTDALRNFAAGFDTPKALQQAIEAGELRKFAQQFGPNIDQEVVRTLGDTQLGVLQNRAVNQADQYMQDLLAEGTDHVDGRKQYIQYLNEQGIGGQKQIELLKNYQNAYKASYGLTDEQLQQYEAQVGQLNEAKQREQERLNFDWDMTQAQYKVPKVYAFDDPDRVTIGNSIEEMRAIASDNNWLPSDDAKGQDLGPKVINMMNTLEQEITKNAKDSGPLQSQLFAQHKGALLKEAALRLGAKDNWLSDDKYYDLDPLKVEVKNIFGELLNAVDNERILSEYFDAKQRTEADISERYAAEQANIRNTLRNRNKITRSR